MINTLEKEKIERVPTSIKINPEIWKMAKIEAIKGDVTVSELLEEAVMEYIKKQERGKHE